ncbi:aldehyde dehydrogenase family protein, partial [Novosphingobium sp. MBES04]|uniref:aldehyde dehydrogenase family protein n=1 Tax=Novosphingobium sp. MBES04 TaxID=1206458 RepID=UPI00057D35AA
MTQATRFDGHAIAPETEAFLGQTHKLLIGGEWVEGSGEMETLDPATGLALTTFQTGGKAEVDKAVAAARKAFDGTWGRMTVAARTAILHKLARIMEENATLLTELDILDNGMPRFIAGLTTSNVVEMI